MSRYALHDICAARSLLFVPGNRPERFIRATSARPDIVIIDLEDAVGEADKDIARTHAHDWLGNGHAAMLRINAATTPWYQADCELVDEFGPPVMLPKSERTDQVRLLGALHAGDVVVVPLIETATGILAASQLAAQDCVARLAFGSIDLAAQLGVEPDDREALLFARSALVLASAAAGCPPPIDGVTTVLDQADLVQQDFDYARGLGMTAKLCIHPKQIEIVHATAKPSAELLAWAKTIVNAGNLRGSALAVDGRMVDKPVLDRARKVLADAGGQENPGE
ncbi:HpcH/HpaI aldolase/citrate lyase family protein [Mycobacterium avium]|uniref:HpcH/HpaI aldolase/citrate lyase family protein n=1 Tax=Mycobacterium avium TaxID=1764 RepID=UPI000A017985|nr:CoA ester lyase [Mycobacterium avium]